MRPFIKSIIPLTMLLFQQLTGFSQKDSTKIWADKLMSCTSQDDGFVINAHIKNFAQKNSREALIVNTSYCLKVAAKSGVAKYVFPDLFDIFQNESQKRALDKEFNLAILNMEEDPAFSAHDVKYELYYFYSQLYYRLKQYYYATKYIHLFLADGATSFPENIRTSIELNALTTLALINRNKEDIDTSVREFKVILELSKAKQNSAWEGITSGNLAYSLALANRFAEAIPYYKTDDQLSTKNHETGSALSARIALGEIYLKLDKLDSAYTYSDSANKLLNSILTSSQPDAYLYLDEQQEIFSFFGNYYYQTGDFKKSSEYFTKAFLLKDSIQQLEKSNHLQQVVQSIAVDKNLNEISELHNEIRDKKQSLNFVITVAAAVACILILLAFFLVRLLSKNQQLKEQNDIIHQQTAALEKINSDNNKLFSIISHDVRGPAASVHRLLQFLGGKTVSREHFEKLLPSVLNNSANLNATIDSLLTWSTAQFNSMETSPEKIEVKSFIDNMILLFKEQAKDKLITIENNCVPQNVFIDKNQFEIIIRNTVNNAIKFSHPDTVIRFSSADAGADAVISLADTGIGMTNEQIDNIMKGTELKTTTGTGGEKGIGLGMKLVKEFIERNAGTFKIESIPGVGTTLIFTIPKVVG